MAKPVNFYGPYLKIERAEHHIRQLERIFGEFLRKNEQTLRKSRDLQSGPTLGVSFPRHTPTILGDVLHNLRAALDHAYCALVEANGHRVHERSFFPIVNPNGKDSWQSRKASIEGHEEAGHGLGARIIDVLSNEIQPYEGGNGADLVKLHVLDIADKHVILLPTQQLIHAQDVSLEAPGLNVTFSGVTFITRGIPVAGPGLVPNQGYNQKATFQISFGRGQPFEGEPILPVLKGLSSRVRETLHLLEQRAKETF